MKLKNYAFIICMIIFSISCKDDDLAKDDATAACLTPPEFTIKNSSQYIINRILIHTTPDYMNTTPSQSDLQTGEEIFISISAGEYYITFIRNITSTSDTEIAITTENSITLEGCNVYKLHLLEEDFLME